MDAAHNEQAAAGLFDRRAVILFLASFVALYFELVIIRYLSSEIRTFAYLKNLALIASFFGIGLGMMLGGVPDRLKRAFPLVVTVLFTVIAFASPLRLTHVVFPAGDYLMFGEINLRRGPWFFIQGFLMVLAFLVVIPGIMYLLIAFFAVFGGTVGQSLKPFKPLKGYGINLVGSLAGIVAFTLLSFWCSPPWVWIVVGFIAGLPFFVKDWRVVLSFALVVVAVAFSHPRTYWSPYYRIELKELLPPEGWNKPTGYFLTVNHDYHQMMLNLSSEFLTRYPGAEPYQSALSNYELPYKVVHHPERVLVVGAGTGNDVAAALRHGARHIDAVEIDPVILDLGRRYHPERPYDSDRVTVHVDDARAYFHQCRQKYDVIVFGYLDSHTLLTSMSSVRLDNYVYTLESFREARALLAKGGVIALAFSSGKSFVGDRMFATLSRAFGVPARAYFTENAQSGVAYFEGENLNTSDITEFPEISSEFQSRMARVTLATDHWPFLYLQSRNIPFMILSVLLLFLYVAVAVVKRSVRFGAFRDPRDLHLFFLGAGFMLLETKGVTELSLLFGSTWVVNAAVIAGFLLMGALANLLVASVTTAIPWNWVYAILFLLLFAGMFFPYSALTAFSGIKKIGTAVILVGLPALCSGVLFSRSFNDTADPARGLGINLLGTVVGGMLENLVMIGGTPVLGVLGIALYGISALGLYRSLPKQSLLFSAPAKNETAG